MLLGEVISDTNEKTSLGVAQKICSDVIEETHAVLRKVWAQGFSPEAAYHVCH